MSHPESSPIYKNDFLVRSWKDLKNKPIASQRHFDCALLIQSNSKLVGVYHHPASDADGKVAQIKLHRLKDEISQVNISCVVHKINGSYSQAALLHSIEYAMGVHPKTTDINLSEFALEGPIDILITTDGIFAKINGRTQLLLSSSEIR